MGSEGEIDGKWSCSKRSSGFRKCRGKWELGGAGAGAPGNYNPRPVHALTGKRRGGESGEGLV